MWISNPGRRPRGSLTFSVKKMLSLRRGFGTRRGRALLLPTFCGGFRYQGYHRMSISFLLFVCYNILLWDLKYSGKRTDWRGGQIMRWGWQGDGKMTSRWQEYIVEPLRVELTVVFKQITEFELSGKTAGWLAWLEELHQGAEVRGSDGGRGWPHSSNKMVRWQGRNFSKVGKLIDWDI